MTDIQQENGACDECGYHVAHAGVISSDHAPSCSAHPDALSMTSVRHTVSITREQLEAWAGRPLADDEIDRLDESIPNSSIPDTVGEIVASWDD